MADAERPRKAPAKKAAKKAPAKAQAAAIVAQVIADTPAAEEELNAPDPAYEAFQKRLTGASWAEVIEDAPFETEQEAALAVNRYLQRAAAAMSHEMAQSALVQELMRLDALQASWWTMATLGDKDAAAIVLKVIKMRADLLKLTQAEKTTERQTIIITDGGDMAEQMRQLVEQQQAEARAARALAAGD